MTRPLVHLVELDGLAPQPWRNGGGSTRELLAWPPGSGTGWQLRVSVADIERSGPFSAYPGVQRCFTVLEGAGVVLGLAEGGCTLTPLSAPVAFDGALAPDCRLVGGPTRDLNLMARADAGRPRMHAACSGPAIDSARSLWRGLYVAETLHLAVGPGEPMMLPARTLAWADGPGAAWQVLPAGAAPRAWWLALERG